MVDFSLSDEQKMLQKTARGFAEKEIKPVAEAIDKMDRSKYTPWDLCKPIVKKASKLGFMTLLIPEEYGGGGLGCMENVILQEELAAVDIGIASAYFNVSITGPMLLLVGANEDQKKKWLSELCDTSSTHVIASAGSEPDQAGSDSLCPYPDPKMGMRTTAVLDRDEYVINGAKSAFITNAGAAKHYFVIARSDLTKPPFESTSIFYIPSNLPGFSVGKLTELIGWRTVQNAEVFFDNVRVPKDCLLGEEGKGLPIFVVQSLPFIGIGFAACHVGLARAAYEYALEYSRQRVSWGQPIIRHQAVAGMLADAAIDLQAARLVVWDGAYTLDSKQFEQAPLKQVAAKTFAVDVAIKNAETCVKVLGSYGITREYKAAKYLSDAWIGYPCDGSNQILRLHMANFL